MKIEIKNENPKEDELNKENLDTKNETAPNLKENKINNEEMIKEGEIKKEENQNKDENNN